MARSHSPVRKTAAAADLQAPAVAGKDDAARWGRARKVSWLTTLFVTFLLTFAPVIVGFFWVACKEEGFKCSLVAPVQYAWEKGLLNTLVKFAVQSYQECTCEVVLVFVGYVLLQAFLGAVLPGSIVEGARTPDGSVPLYKVTGIQQWVVTHALFLFLVAIYGTKFGSYYYDHMGGFVFVCWVYGNVVSLLVYLRARIRAADDQIFSGSIAYDIFMGIELHPRIGKMFDLKLFHNSRVGMMAWSLIAVSYLFAQFNQLGYVSWSMYASVFLLCIYIVDFFWREHWYLHTIDIALDHFGWYLCWGITNWLPVVYSLQPLYILSNPESVEEYGLLYHVGCVVVGLIGYFIFRAANEQRWLFREHKGQCTVYGTKATFVSAKYNVLRDGVLTEHESTLLTSSWWGIARHFNYIGDLILSLAYSLPAGFHSFFPYFYFFYMTALLIARVKRDDDKCRRKYGKYWDTYCAEVKWAMLPGVW